MRPSRAARLTQRLDALRALSPELEAVALISVEGVIIASSIAADLEGERLASMSAAMLALGERIAGDLGRGALEQVFIKGQNGFVLLLALDQGALLTALASEEAKLGLALFDMRAAAVELRAAL